MTGKHTAPEQILVAADVQEWRTVPGFPAYEVSNDGYLRRAVGGSNTKVGKLLRFKFVRNGYPSYGLSHEDGTRQWFSAHRLVALTFLPKPTAEQNFVLHGDDNKLNARHDNLRWGTAAENTADAKRNGCDAIVHSSTLKPWTRPRGQNHSSAKLTEAQVRAIMADQRMQKDIAAEYGVDGALIYRIKAGQVWKHITNPEYRAMLEAGAAFEPLSQVKRKQLNSRDLSALMERESRTCHLCSGQIGATEAWDVSHEIPLAQGGEDTETNWRMAHRKCHRAHTATVDLPAIAKTRRIRARHFGAKAPSRRPLPFGRNSKLKKKVNGQVVQR